MIDQAANLLFLMLAGHAFADFGIQTPYHSAAKRPGSGMSIPWPVALGCHSLIHGGLVAAITGYWWLGLAETVAHGATDYGKGRGWYGSYTDQLLHIYHKTIWAGIAIGMGI